MIIEQGACKTMYYAIYKDEKNLIGFVGDNCGFAFDIDVIDEYIPTNLDYFCPIHHSNLFGLDINKEWIGTDYNLDTKIDKIKQDMKKVIDVLIAMVFAQASGQVDFDKKEE